MANADRSAEQFRKMTETPIPKLILSLAASSQRRACSPCPIL